MWSGTPESRGAMKSARQKLFLGMLARCPVLSACWRRKWKVVRTLLAGVVGVELDVVAYGVGGVEAYDGAGGECLEGDDLVEEVPGVAEEGAGLASVGGVLEDGGVGAAKLPGEEEWGPVYVVHELVEGVVAEDAGCR